MSTCRILRTGVIIAGPSVTRSLHAPPALHEGHEDTKIISNNNHKILCGLRAFVIFVDGRWRVHDLGVICLMDDGQPKVEGHAGLKWIRGSGVCRDWNGIRYKLGMSGKNVGAQALSMNVAVIPPGGVAGAHIHVGFEVMLYILEGRVRHEFGTGLTESVDHAAGDFIFIAPGVPHEVFNLSDTDPVVAVVARSSADEWDKIVPYDKAAARK